VPKPGGKLRSSRIAFVVGTRPEAIKLSPVAHALVERGEPPLLFVTGQHPGLELRDHRLDEFEAIHLHCPGQPDPMLHADLVRGAVRRALDTRPPEMVVVQGDTSSALGGALAAREAGMILAHVEAGLRTYDLTLPWPEEENRIIIDRLSDLLIAPTSANAANLRREGVRGRVHVTGNSGIDALAALVGPLPLPHRRSIWPRLSFGLLVTCHRRENWGEGLDQLAEALIELGQQGVRSRVVLPPNAGVAERMTALLDGKANIRLTPPMSHRATIEAMRSADLVLSDSGGMQEEAPALGAALLILREKTERPEGLADGASQLIGTDAEGIVAAVNRLRHHRAELNLMRRPRLPFGDGHASARIAAHCIDYLEEQAHLRESRTG
jgi:UDP-N-acetylglucosamine 2-epimerase (non-hydrolysing)